MIVLVALGNGIRIGFANPFAALARQISVTSSSEDDDRTAREITDADVEAPADRVDAPDVVSVVPVVTGPASCSSPGAPGSAPRSPARPLISPG